MFIPKSINQAKDTAERVEHFCKSNIIAISKQEAQELTARLFGFQSWTTLKQATETEPFSAFDEDVSEVEREERRQLQITCLLDKFSNFGLRRDDAASTLLLLRPTGRPPARERPDFSNLGQQNASLQAAALHLQQEDWIKFNEAIIPCIAHANEAVAQAGFALLEHASRRSPQTRLNFGLAHIYGHGIKKDVGKGVSILQELRGQRGLDKSTNELIRLVLGDNALGLHGGGKPNKELARSLYLEATHYGIEGMAKIGDMYEQEADFDSAVDAFSVAADAGHPHAAFRIASIIMIGPFGFFKEAKHYLEIAARGGHPDAQKTLPYLPNIKIALKKQGRA
jgi:hypothetical protein